MVECVKTFVCSISCIFTRVSAVQRLPPIGEHHSNSSESLFGVLPERRGKLTIVTSAGSTTTDRTKTSGPRTRGTHRSFLACPDSQHLWAVGQAGDITFSADRGETWQPQKEWRDPTGLDVAFVDARRGIPVEISAPVVRTDDGDDVDEGRACRRTPSCRQLHEVVAPGDIVLYSAAFANRIMWIVRRVSDDSAPPTAVQAGTSGEARDDTLGVTLLTATWLGGSTESPCWRPPTAVRSRRADVGTPKGFSLALYDVRGARNLGWAVGNSGSAAQQQGLRCHMATREPTVRMRGRLVTRSRLVARWTRLCRRRAAWFWQPIAKILRHWERC